MRKEEPKGKEEEKISSRGLLVWRNDKKEKGEEGSEKEKNI